MKTQSLILAAVATYAGVSEAGICWTNGLNLLMGGQPWGGSCNQPPVNPPPPPPPPACVPNTVYKIDPAVAASAKAACMALNPPRNTPLFDENGNPACCVPIYSGGVQVC